MFANFITFRYAPYPQRCSPTSALPDLCVFRFLTRLTFWMPTGGGFVLIQLMPLVRNGHPFKIGATIFLVVLFGKLYPSGLTREDTSACAGKDLHLTWWVTTSKLCAPIALRVERMLPLLIPLFICPACMRLELTHSLSLSVYLLRHRTTQNPKQER